MASPVPSGKPVASPMSSDKMPGGKRTREDLEEEARQMVKAAKLDGIDGPAPKFPFDLSTYHKVVLNPYGADTESLTATQKSQLLANIELCRNATVFFTCTGAASGYGGHTGGAFDTVPEVCLLEAIFNGAPDKVIPTLYDEAGHRVATQYLRSALKGKIPAEQLLHYRKGHMQLPGHPEVGLTPGVEFSSGRLGHMWPFVNGVAMREPQKAVVMLGSDGSQMEGNDAEAARLAVANNLSVKLFVDDNDVTIAGHPSEYLKGFSVAQTLRGHGLTVYETVEGDIDKLWAATRACFRSPGPAAVVIRRKMAPGVKDVEGTCKGHDVFSLPHGIKYLEERSCTKAVEILKQIKPASDPYKYLGSGKRDACRVAFGVEAAKIIGQLPKEERKRRVLCIDSDLEGSTGIKAIREAHPELYVKGGVMERGNFSACAGFGAAEGTQGIFSTFCAFLEMCNSEITMARLNNANVLCHFSHSGVDDMADNTCHFGLNAFFADNGLGVGPHGEAEDHTRLYYPADVAQLQKLLPQVFWDKGLRFVFSTRSKLPAILKEDGSAFFDGKYEFTPGKDDLIRPAGANGGFVVSFGDALYRSLDAVTRLKQEEKLEVGLVNHACLNMVDEEMMKKLAGAPFVLVVESLSKRTGLGVRFGTWLLQRGFKGKYAQIGVDRIGSGGLHEHAYHQGYDPKSIMDQVRGLAK